MKMGMGWTCSDMLSVYQSGHKYVWMIRGTDTVQPLWELSSRQFDSPPAWLIILQLSPVNLSGCKRLSDGLLYSFYLK